MPTNTTHIMTKRVMFSETQMLTTLENSIDVSKFYRSIYGGYSSIKKDKKYYK
jgi:hypothetical protein